ncbi:hypothetical protein [Nostoc sp. CHAB 5715]|nr:hypothetical protein [Nostoc sp. CHAB 5715]
MGKPQDRSGSPYKGEGTGFSGFPPIHRGATALGGSADLKQVAWD